MKEIYGSYELLENYGVTKVMVDLTDWSRPYPTGAVAYSGDLVVASEYCETQEEFREFLDELKEGIAADTEIHVHMDMEDIEAVTPLVLQIRADFRKLREEAREEASK